MELARTTVKVNTTTTMFVEEWGNGETTMPWTQILCADSVHTMPGLGFGFGSGLVDAGARVWIREWPC